jgi:hypothetical protein
MTQENKKQETKRKGLFGGFSTKVKTIGEKTVAIGQQAKGAVSQEKAGDAVKNLLELVTKVARDARNNLDPDMVKAVDLSAYISLPLIRVGVSVDLEKLQPKKIVVSPKSSLAN